MMKVNKYYPIQQNGKLGFIVKTGKIVISPQFDSGYMGEDGCFSEGLATVQVGEKWGYIDKTGKFVIPPKFKGIPSLFDGGLAIAETKGNQRSSNGQRASQRVVGARLKRRSAAS